MTWNNLLHLMNDIRERILPKNITYIFFVKKKSLFDPAVYCRIFTLFAIFRLHSTALPAQKWPSGTWINLYSNLSPPCQSVSPNLFFRFDTISLTVCATFFSLLVGTSVNIRRFVSDSKASPYNTNEPKCWTLKSRNDCLLP